MRTLLGALFGLALFAGAAQAQETMSADELDGARGGLMTPWGVEIGFGAVVRTYVDGALALESQLTWTPEGASRTYQTGAPTADLATVAAANGLKLSTGTEGLLIPGQAGATVVLHDVAGGRLAGLVLNTADNRDIRQATEITLNVPQFEALQQGFAAQAMTSRLSAAVGQALRDAPSR